MANRSKVKWPCCVVLEENQRGGENSQLKQTQFLSSQRAIISHCYVLAFISSFNLFFSSLLTITVQPEQILNSFYQGMFVVLSLLEKNMSRFEQQAL